MSPYNTLIHIIDLNHYAIIWGTNDLTAMMREGPVNKYKAGQMEMDKNPIHITDQGDIMICRDVSVLQFT